MPKIDKYIEDLEKIKQTQNYDEKITNIRPVSVIKFLQISCFDLFETNNIKHMKSNKIIYGTAAGSIILYDIESQRMITEKQLGSKSRVDIISSSTVKYYDTYLSRIAVHFRGEPTVHILSYNHSYSLINSECVINLNEEKEKEKVKDLKSNQIIDPAIGLSSLVSSIKFSKDTYYMAIIDYAAGVRIYKFNDIPQNIVNSNINTSISSSNRDKDNINQSSLKLNFQPSKAQVNVQDKKTIDNVGTNNPYILINYIKYKEPENYTIINQNKQEESKDKEKDVKKPNLDNKKLNRNQPLNNNKSTLNLSNLANNTQIDESNYNHKTIMQNNNDLTPLQKFNKNQPLIAFVQKKLIFEEKLNGGFSSCLVTIGLYISFYCTNNLKFISLYPHLTENMKNIFKVTKTKPSGHLSQEESISLSSSMAKKEKEYINYIKVKLESMINNINLTSNPTKIKNDSIIEPTKTEINFNTLFPITCIAGQKSYNNLNNLIAIGMKDGSIVVWDVELHTDKYFFQDKRDEITSLSLDENYLTVGSLDGQIHIYDLLKGNLVYNCYHNAYKNYPVMKIFPFFSFLNLVIDTNQRMLIYNAKEKHKISKIQLEYNGKNYHVKYFNEVLINFSEDFVVVVCGKDNSPKEKNNVIDLINFQKEQSKPSLVEFKNGDFINHFQNKTTINNEKSYIAIFKTKDIILKSYPQLLMANKKGLSLKKILQKYEINNIPSFDKSK